MRNRKGFMWMNTMAIMLVLALMATAAPVVADNGLRSGYSKIRDWDKAHEAFSFANALNNPGMYGGATTSGGDFFIAPRGIHVFDSPGIIDMGLIRLDAIGEAPASGYMEMATPLDGHSYVVRSGGKYGKFYIDETYDWLDPVEYGIQWVYQSNGARTFEGAASSAQPTTPGQTGTVAETGCTYEQYIAAYNKLTSLMSQGQGNTPEAQIAYEQYAKIKACYESGGSGTGSPSTSTTTPGTTTTTTTTTPTPAPTSTSTSTPTTIPAGTGLVLHLPFDGSYNDASGYGNHGTPKGNMRFTPGVVGQQAAYFDGKSYVEIPDSNSLDLSRAFTFSVWLNREITTGGWWYVLSKGDTSETGDYAPYSLWHSHSGIGTQIPSVTLADHGQPRYVHSSTPTDARVWYHLAVTWDGNNVKFYKDGVGDTKPWQGAQLLPNSPSKLVIGCVPPVPQGAMYERYFKGMMDDLRIYNYALSDSEVQGVYSGAGHATPTPTPTPTPTISGQQQLYPVADGSIYAYSYRNWNWANLGQYENMGAGWNPTGGEKRSYLRFDLPAGAGISRAVLKLYQDHRAGSGHTLGVYRVTSPWYEGTDTYHSGEVEETAAPGELCWMQQPSFDPVPVATFSSATDVPAWVEVDITSLVQKWQSGTANYGLVVKTANDHLTKSDPEAMSGFRTKEEPQQAHRPVLDLSAGGTVSNVPVTTTTTVTSTPTPAGTALIAESRTAAPGSTVQVPVYFQNAQNVGSLGFKLAYNPSVVQVIKVSKGSLMSPATFTSNVQPDYIIFGFATPQSISGTGSAAVVEFQALGAEGSRSPLTLTEIMATGSSGATLSVNSVNGELSIGQKQIGDADGDGKLSVLDALIALKMYVQLLPLDLTADINKDGRVTPEDARLIIERAKP